MSFFLGSWGMNRSAEQTNRTRTASRFTRFVCPALRFIPNEPRKKRHSFLNTRAQCVIIVQKTENMNMDTNVYFSVKECHKTEVLRTTRVTFADMGAI